jgi:hypothetical protein
MLRGLLIFPTIFWLLLPQGFCICHLPEQALQTLNAFLDPNAPTPLSEPSHEEDEHVPGCPSNKMPVVQQASWEGHLAPVLPTGLPTEAAAVPLLAAIETAFPLGPSHSGPVDPPLYLTLRALLI